MKRINDVAASKEKEKKEIKGVRLREEKTCYHRKMRNRESEAEP